MGKFTQITREQFESLNRRLGLMGYTASESQELINAMQGNANPMIFSSDPLESSVPPSYINVASIAELKNLTGNPSHFDDDHVHYPPPLEPARLALFRTALSTAEFVQTIDKEFADQLTLAEDAYIKGGPEKLEEYVPLINASSFPRRIAVFTGTHLEVPPGQTYTITGDEQVSLNFESVSIGQDARILIKGKATINIEKIDEADLDKFFFEG